MKKNRKKYLSRRTMCKIVWKRRIIAQKGCSEKCAEEHVLKCIALIEHMLYGHAMIAFQKQDGTLCMEQGTLIVYERFFHKSYQITPSQLSVIFWDTNRHAWRRFMIENLAEWKPIA